MMHPKVRDTIFALRAQGATWLNDAADVLEGVAKDAQTGIEQHAKWQERAEAAEAKLAAQEAEVPIERLDAVIREIVNTIETEAQLSGWVLGYSTSEITNEKNVSPVGSGYNYVVGPSTLITDALGITVATSAVVQTVLVENRLNG